MTLSSNSAGDKHKKTRGFPLGAESVWEQWQLNLVDTARVSQQEVAVVKTLLSCKQSPSVNPRLCDDQVEPVFPVPAVPT